MKKTSTIPDRRQTSRRGLLAKNAMPLSLAAEQGEDFYTVLSPDSQPLVRLYSMDDLEEMLGKAGLTNPIKLA